VNWADGSLHNGVRLVTPRRWPFSCVAFATSIAIVGTSVAAVFTVPGSSATIQGAIALAADGDTILVSNGTYHETINFTGKNVIVRSVNGSAATTIVAAPQMPSVLFVNAESRAAMLSGFTITGGSPGFVPPYFGNGGGIFVSGSAAPTIINNVIANNVACNGGGIASQNASPLVQGNLISGNHADCSQLGFSGLFWGGGISLAGASAAEVRGNMIIDNVAGVGSGIGMFAAGTPIIANNILLRNFASNDCQSIGGTVWMVNESDADIIQNLIANNTATCSAGVVWSVPSGARGPNLINNTIALNDTAGVIGGGFDDNIRMVNNIVVAKPGQTAIVCGHSYGNPNQFRNNVVFSSNGADYVGSCASQRGINGNQPVDPNFVSGLGGDFHLAAGSRAIDAGFNGEPMIPSMDLDGKPRIVDGNGDRTATIDAGAFEASAPVVSVPTLTLGGLAVLVLMLASAGGIRLGRAARWSPLGRRVG
jgi:hypothetical protein